MTLSDAHKTLADAKAKLEEIKAEAAAERGALDPPVPIREPEPDAPDGQRRCANRSCGHGVAFHDATGRCNSTHTVTTPRVRYVYRLTCAEPHVHDERQCYRQDTEPYEETDIEYCRCTGFDARTPAQVAADEKAAALACVTCGHGPEDHPFPREARCRCAHVTSSGPDWPDRCAVGLQKVGTPAA